MSKQEISTRDRILNAVESLLKEQGSKGVTLDAVAASAGVSKGGLLYHFGSKSELYDGVVARLREREQHYLDEARNGDAVELFMRGSAAPDSDAANLWAIFTFLRGNEELSDQAREDIAYTFQGWGEVLRDSLGDPVLAEAVRLIGDGVYLSALAGLPLPSEELVSQIIDRLVGEK
ncbi:TetR/AcrR family transcriptional regulator [Salininema proteolyticum]|uniref:TetR/AcrR family transcriptional regulator n=1 Tax=Salininema proteolyticum TaxID=1607685 RepID=A0ABV8U0B9_9ACTN